MSAKCPGMNPQNWKPQDITEQPCPRCCKLVEFWKDDVFRRCPSCGFELTNRALGSTCLAWCDRAAECIGTAEIDKWKSEKSGKQGIR